MISNNFEAKLKQKEDQVNQLLEDYCPKKDSFNEEIVESLKYSLLVGGKRLRPILMAETYALFGGNEKVIEPFMVAMEMIHSYSLVHDDLPAMDNDDYRRGNKTTWSKYGEDIGILAGDALLNFAYETAFTGVALTKNQDRAIKALKVLAKKAGIYGMIGGQSVDVKNTGREINKETLSYIYQLKTGALIQAAMMVGAILAGASQEEVKIVEEMALSIGMAFQIQDDILDLTATKEELGKPIQSDLKNKKITYVTLYGMQEAKEKVNSYSKESIKLYHSLAKENSFLESLIEFLINRRK
ncbi:MAG TPA: polyprenyl synthetase family protein [Candidatus Dorea intestinavium]|nr:polyprenyl synthetase family protein [Candidatus Dorea intestinavium]